MGPFYHREARARGTPRTASRTLFKLHYDDVVFGNTLFKKLPSGKFEEVSDKASLETWWPWGIAVGDFDNDGYEDVFLPSGMGYPYGYWPNALMMNNGNETFTDRAAKEGIEPPPGGTYLEEHDRRPGRRAAARAAPRSPTSTATAGSISSSTTSTTAPIYYRNQFPKKNYVAFRLDWRRPSATATPSGRWCGLHCGDEVMVRQVHAAGGYLSQSSKTLHFGLGDRTKIDRVEIQWPQPGGGYHTQTIDETGDQCQTSCDGIGESRERGSSSQPWTGCIKPPGMYLAARLAGPLGIWSRTHALAIALVLLTGAPRAALAGGGRGRREPSSVSWAGWDSGRPSICRTARSASTLDWTGRVRWRNAAPSRAAAVFCPRHAGSVFFYPPLKR